jgi:hypothetical protein
MKLNVAIPWKIRTQRACGFMAGFYLNLSYAKDKAAAKIFHEIN